jgi:glycosyltransferase involved in cell wall biosynthesis
METATTDHDEPGVDVLIPTYQRPAGLAMTLLGLVGQTYRHFRVIVSSQDDDAGPEEANEVRAAVGVLRAHGHRVEIHRHLPRRGMAEHRQSLLDRVDAPYALFLDDDIYLEPDVLERLVRAIRAEGCGFVGCAPIGWSYAEDVRPEEERIELWEGPVQPEQVSPRGHGWERHRLHNAANLLHVQRRLALTPEEQRLYRVAWVGACVLYDIHALRAAGGFSFWEDLPIEHAGEDVVAQLRVMAQRGGCAIIPSGAWHLELPTTIAQRDVDAPHAIPV